MRICTVLLFPFLHCLHVSAQSSLSGTVIERGSRKPVEYVTVELVHLPDSAISKVVITDKKGKFLLPNVKPAKYLVKCSFIGFDKVFSGAFYMEAGTKEQVLPFIELVNHSKPVSDVTVVGRRLQLNASIDRKIYNVDQDIMSRSGTVSDILKNIPSVEVDVEGNVSLRGSGDILILINGKPNPLMGKTKAEVLQSLPANFIERVEVITNPSARYRPDGTSGIINIVLKKNVKNGFNGMATINAGNKDRYNGNLSLNYRPGKLNVFSNYSIRQDTRKRYHRIDRTYIDSTTTHVTGFFNQLTHSVARPLTHVITGGVDYTLNGKNSLGASGTYFYREQVRNDETRNLRFNNQKSLTQDFTRMRYNPEFEKQKSATLYFQHGFKKEDHEIRFEFNTSVEAETEDNHYATTYQLPAYAKVLDNTIIKQGTNQNQLTIDYSNPLTEDAKLEAGYDGLYNQSDLSFFGEYYDATLNKYVTDAIRTNRFMYNEDVHAIYTTYQRGYKKFGYEIGIRSEAVFTKGHLVTLDSFVYNNYFKVYPTIHLSYKLKKQSELQLNYSKRVNRPEANELNPFPEFQDPRNLKAGNPKLLPEIIHSTEFGYKWQNKKFSIIPSIYYRYKVNAFTSVIVPLNDSTLLTTTQNLSNDQSAGLEVIITVKAGKFFSASSSLNLFYNRINASNLGYITNRSIYAGSLNLNSSFTLSKTTMLQLSSHYRSAKLTPQGRNSPAIIVNMGMRQDLAKNKIAITLTASDLFSSNRHQSSLNTPYLKQVSVNSRDGLIVYLGVSYRFGIVKKVKEAKLEFDNNL